RGVVTLVRRTRAATTAHQLQPAVTLAAAVGRVEAGSHVEHPLPYQAVHVVHAEGVGGTGSDRPWDLRTSGGETEDAFAEAGLGVAVQLLEAHLGHVLPLCFGGEPRITCFAVRGSREPRHVGGRSCVVEAAEVEVASPAAE